VGNRRGRSKGAEFEGENKRGGGVYGGEVEGWRGEGLLYRIGGVRGVGGAVR
jgi:hypothetical protein